MSAWRDIGTALRGGPRVWTDIMLASWELGRANIELRGAPLERLRLLERTGADGEDERLTGRQQALVERVAYMVPIMGRRVPWRSDCLVQALAARRWLAHGRIGSELCLGVRKDGDGFEAHAWLKVGERIVTGGDVSDYRQLPASQVRREQFAS